MKTLLQDNQEKCKKRKKREKEERGKELLHKNIKISLQVHIAAILKVAEIL